MYLDLDNIPFYIGKGKDNRYCISCHLHKNVVNNLLKNKIKKVGAENVKIQLLHKDIAEEAAFQFEIFYIGFYGRRDLGKGTLCNLTNGGEGNSGMVGKVSPMKGKHHSKETRQKISRANKGKQNTKGKVHSKETKQKMQEAWKHRKARGDVPWKGSRRSDATRKKMAKSHEIFSNEVVRKIRRLSKRGISQQQIANIFNVNQSTISHIVNYKVYKYVE